MEHDGGCNLGGYSDGKCILIHRQYARCECKDKHITYYIFRLLNKQFHSHLQEGVPTIYQTKLKVNQRMVRSRLYGAALTASRRKLGYCRTTVVLLLSDLQVSAVFVVGEQK